MPTMTETTEALEPQVCPICSALAADMTKHLDWHQRASRDAANAGAAAGSDALRHAVEGIR